jgi:hypothetical protein
VNARRIVVVAVLAAAVVVAVASFAAVGVRLAQSPRDGAGPVVRPSAALRVFDRRQTAQEFADSDLFGLGPAPSATVRRLGRPEGLVVVGWRTRSGEVCEGAYRAGPSPVTSQSCAKAQDFADGGVSIGWPDSPDLGPFDLTWMPDGRLVIAARSVPSGAPTAP